MYIGREDWRFKRWPGSIWANPDNRSKTFAERVEFKNPFVANFGRSMGIDSAYGPSSFGIVITQLLDNEVQVLYADEFQRPGAAAARIKDL
jgi:hypothetical protein